MDHLVSPEGLEPQFPKLQIWGRLRSDVGMGKRDLVSPDMVLYRGYVMAETSLLFEPTSNIEPNAMSLQHLKGYLYPWLLGLWFHTHFSSILNCLKGLLANLASACFFPAGGG